MEELDKAVESLHNARRILNEIRNESQMLTKTAIGHSIEELGVCEQNIQEIKHKLEMILV